MIYNEDKQNAFNALKNALWLDFSDLVNKYLEAAEGLVDYPEARFQDVTSIFGRKKDHDGDGFITIYTTYGVPMDEQCFGNGWTCGHSTMLEALADEDALEIFIHGKRVFERCDGQWYYLE